MELPEDFRRMMQGLLQEEASAFFQEYQKSKAQGLRVNTLKTTIPEFLAHAAFPLEPVPWSQAGFYYSSQARPGKHPYHEAGVYYLQEPSAMAAAELLDPHPGEKVLDLCAAPGGKSTHIAQKMKRQGLLWANEIHAARAKILSQNIERLGIGNAVVTNESPQRLAARLPAFFDRILVDAPCSGEGMFRKDEQARAEWSLENVSRCARRQQEILTNAGMMLKPGGRMVYSTCTFNPQENESVIASFLQKNPGFSLVDAPCFAGFSSGRAEWAAQENPDIKKTIRLWPHHLRGEGHFYAVLKKNTQEQSASMPAGRLPVLDPKEYGAYAAFAKENLTKPPQGEFLMFGEQLYLAPEGMPDCREIRILRPGLHLGTVKKNWFQPSHALALAITPKQAGQSYALPLDSEKLPAYLRGEEIPAQGEKGWYLITVDGYSLGWGKLTHGSMKNHYPKGLRWR